MASSPHAMLRYATLLLRKKDNTLNLQALLLAARSRPRRPLIAGGDGAADTLLGGHNKHKEGGTSTTRGGAQVFQCCIEQIYIKGTLINVDSSAGINTENLYGSNEVLLLSSSISYIILLSSYVLERQNFSFNQSEYLYSVVLIPSTQSEIRVLLIHRWCHWESHLTRLSKTELQPGRSQGSGAEPPGAPVSSGSGRPSHMAADQPLAQDQEPRQRLRTRSQKPAVTVAKPLHGNQVPHDPLHHVDPDQTLNKVVLNILVPDSFNDVMQLEG